jgi:hypothetical protein
MLLRHKKGTSGWFPTGLAQVAGPESGGLTGW